MEMTASKTVAEWVTDNYRAADIFKKYGIDFCCGGGVTVAEICRQKKLDYTEIENELLALDNQVARSHDFKNWELDFLIDYIEHNHHSYVRESIPTMMEYAKKVAKVHGKNHPETVEIRDLFLAVAEELTQHMHKEESILFPFIKKMVQARRTGDTIPVPAFGTVDNPIRMMEAEHENAGDIFKKISELSNGYQPPAGACNTYRVLYAKLQEFENDLHQHVHLENNILFPKTKALK